MQLNTVGFSPVPAVAAGPSSTEPQANQNRAPMPTMAAAGYIPQRRLAPDVDLDAPDFDALSQIADAYVSQSEVMPADDELVVATAQSLSKAERIALELEAATFDPSCTLQGDCAVQAYVDFIGVGGLVDAVRNGLQKGDQPFEVTVGTDGDGKPIKVKVDPAVYRDLTAAAPDGPGLNPSQALTMVVRLAVANAIDPGACITWKADGHLALDGSRAEAGLGLDSRNATRFLAQAGLPVPAELGNFFGENDVLPIYQGQLLLFIADPDTGISHPVMATPEGNGYRIPGREQPLSQDEVRHLIINYMTGNVATNGGWFQTNGKNKSVTMGGGG